MQNPQEQEESDEEETFKAKKLERKKKREDKRKHKQKEEYVSNETWLIEDPCEEIQLQAQVNQNETYDLKKGIRVAIASDRNVINGSKTLAQKLTSVISLRTLETTSQENQNLEELAPSDNRLPIDLIAVIDCSGSMGGVKMKTVKESLNILLSFFSEKDRLAVVKFENHAETVMGLKRTDSVNMDGIKKIIQSELRAGGSTSIPSGLNLAVDILKNRKSKNKIVSVFVLSDGNDNDNKAAEKIKLMLEQSPKDLEFTIHSFGFGDDHDSELLSEIAKLRNGNFYYIQELEQINECFVNAFGGLLSIVGREALLKLKLEKAGHQIKELSDLKFLKTYGDFWIPGQDGCSYEIKIQNLINGMKRDYVFDLQIPIITHQINEDNRETILATCTLTAKSIDSNEIVTSEAKLKTKFYHEEEEHKEANDELNEEVVVNLFRVQVGEVIETALKLANSNKNDLAIKEIEGLMNKILVSKYVKNHQLQKFLEQLENNKENCKPEIFNDYGKHALINESEVTMKQTGLRNKKKIVQTLNKNDDDDDDENENTIQKTMKRKIKRKPHSPKAQAPNINNNVILSAVTEKNETELQESKLG